MWWRNHSHLDTLHLSFHFRSALCPTLPKTSQIILKCDGSGAEFPSLHMLWCTWHPAGGGAPREMPSTQPAQRSGEVSSLPGQHFSSFSSCFMGKATFSEVPLVAYLVRGAALGWDLLTFLYEKFYDCIRYSWAVEFSGDLWLKCSLIQCVFHLQCSK